MGTHHPHPRRHPRRLHRRRTGIHKVGQHRLLIPQYHQARPQMEVILQTDRPCKRLRVMDSLLGL